VWIELHDTARDHPKILKLAKDLGVSRVTALGHMCSLWLWCLRMSADGCLVSMDIEDIEIGAGWEGTSGAFVEAAKRRELITANEHNEPVLNDWEQYATHLKAAERKKKDRDRKRAEREKKRLSTDVQGHPRMSTKIRTDQTRPDQTRPDQTDITCADVSKDTIGRSGILAVFDHYRTFHPRAHKRPNSKMTEWRRIRDRMAEGSTTDDLCKAIDGMHKTPHNLGENDRNQKYLGLELCMRNASQVTRFVENADRLSPAEQAKREREEMERRLQEAIRAEEEQDDDDA